MAANEIKFTGMAVSWQISRTTLYYERDPRLIFLDESLENCRETWSSSIQRPVKADRFSSRALLRPTIRVLVSPF